MSPLLTRLRCLTLPRSSSWNVVCLISVISGNDPSLIRFLPARSRISCLGEKEARANRGFRLREMSGAFGGRVYFDCVGSCSQGSCIFLFYLLPSFVSFILLLSVSFDRWRHVVATPRIFDASSGNLGEHGSSTNCTETWISKYVKVY